MEIPLQPPPPVQRVMDPGMGQALEETAVPRALIDAQVGYRLTAGLAQPCPSFPQDLLASLSSVQSRGGPL